MFVYIEYISKIRDAPLAKFHEVMTEVPKTWQDGYPDRPLLNLGRTWRMGPEPSYMCVWYNDAAGLDRLDDWQRIFKSGATDEMEARFAEAARIDRAGCYQALCEPIAGGGGPYYAEFLDYAPGVTREAVGELFDSRVRRHPERTLNLLADRVGTLGPDPRVLAVWSVPSFDAVTNLSCELDAATETVCLVTSGLYADVGEEIL